LTARAAFKRPKKCLLAGIVTVAVALADPAKSAEAPTALPTKGPAVAPAYSWTGVYVGGHFGYGGGTFGPGTNPVPNQAVIFPSSVTGLVGGLQAGFNARFSNRVVLGLEGDVTFPSPPDLPALPPAPFHTTLDYLATARARIGYAFGSLLPYVTGGIAAGQTQVSTNDAAGNVIASKSATHLGWTAGAGVEYALAGRWTGILEYRTIDLGPRTYAVAVALPPTVAVDPRIHIVRLGLNYRLWDTLPWGSPGAPVLKATALPDSDNWNIHGQTTFIAQGYFRFRSPYQGANSLPGGGLGRETWTATAFVGRRLWDGGEFYFNPEIAQGFGLANTLGLGGFANGEAQKAGATFPRIRAQRYFLRQTFGFGGEQETVEDGPNQLAGKRDIDRLTLTIGRIAIGDIFDQNAYAHDPRSDFMNWALWSSAAYDFPADLPGFTRGAVAELNRKSWALRAGAFQVPSEPNSDTLTFKTGGAVGEYEQRYTLLGQAGKLRLGAFANRGRTGNYREALAIAAANPAIDINDAMNANRRQRPKYGFYVNVEQAINDTVGVFARASWNDGKNEILSFTDIDRSVSAGVSVAGRSWGRPNDRIGLGGAINGLSGAHRNFLAAGGLGLLIGDGALRYREEKILEAFYACSVSKSTTLTLDYQFVDNPAYNVDRGPVSIFAVRLHVEQ
jgi:high affinity Mn2+ porin